MTKKYHIYTEEEKEFVKNNITKYFLPDLVKVFNKTFNSNITFVQLKNLKHKMKLKSGLPSTHFGNTYTKGTKRTEEQRARMSLAAKKRATKEYRENMSIARRKAAKKIGYRTINNQGYVYIKIKNEARKNDNYISEARYVYEKHYGEIPKGYWIYHLDGNVSNNNIDNLMALDRKIVASLNITGLKSTDKDLTKLGIDILKINRKIKEKKHQNIIEK